MSKHTTAFTPGPWETKHEFNVIGPNGRGVATTGGYYSNAEDPDVLHDESRANAKLIAAAPLMIEALKAINEVASLGPLDAAAKYGPDVDMQGMEMAAHEQVLAAIKKAIQ